mmetsp:Transcript_27036/g.31201  ORF Transcript_27036/g.31201 Transcript_27036/m.31201 type:complete len:96 (-) Transcript_27036:314-601(-)
MSGRVEQGGSKPLFLKVEADFESLVAGIKEVNKTEPVLTPNNLEEDKEAELINIRKTKIQFKILKRFRNTKKTDNTQVKDDSNDGSLISSFYGSR